MSKPKVAMSAGQVLESLRNGRFPEESFAWLYEVRNGTGYRRTARYADAIICSCWPSRGLWMAGIEVKISRSDWKRELQDPEKSADIQRFMSYWWIAAPAGVVEAIELPKTWGLIEVDGKKTRVVVDAPKLSPEPLSLDFVASLLRNQAERCAASRREGLALGRDQAKEEFGGEKVAELQEEVRKLATEARLATQDSGYLKRDLAELRGTVASFERAAGLADGSISRTHGRFGGQATGEHFKAAELLGRYAPAELAARFRAVAEALEKLPQPEAKEAVGS